MSEVPLYRTTGAYVSPHWLVLGGGASVTIYAPIDGSETAQRQGPLAPADA